MCRVHGLLGFYIRFTGWFEVWSAGLQHVHTFAVSRSRQNVDTIKALQIQSDWISSVSGSNHEDLCQARQKHTLLSCRIETCGFFVKLRFGFDYSYNV